MNKKFVVILILLVMIGTGVGAYYLFPNQRLVNQKPVETYIGGVCTCPPSSSDRLEVVKLYRSKGESLDTIKNSEKTADCSRMGCAMAKEYRLYP